MKRVIFMSLFFAWFTDQSAWAASFEGIYVIALDKRNDGCPAIDKVKIERSIKGAEQQIIASFHDGRHFGQDWSITTFPLESLKVDREANTAIKLRMVESADSLKQIAQQFSLGNDGLGSLEIETTTEFALSTDNRTLVVKQAVADQLDPHPTSTEFTCVFTRVR